jgi:hypothetical protein
LKSVTIASLCQKIWLLVGATCVAVSWPAEEGSVSLISADLQGNSMKSRQSEHQSDHLEKFAQRFASEKQLFAG